MISVIDMPPSEESIWWRGKRGFEVGFFPCECVEVIGDKVPNNLNLPHNSHTLPHLSRRDSTTSDSPSEPTKPVLRKHGKLITFFRSFILSRPARGKLKKSGILKERVFGCDLGEHLLNTGQDGEYSQFLPRYRGAAQYLSVILASYLIFDIFSSQGVETLLQVH